MTYYIVGGDGARFIGETLHTDRDCASIGADAPTRPVADSTVDSLDADEYELCPTCNPVGNGSDIGGDSDATEMQDRDIAQLVEAGECPWCDGPDGYEGDHVGQHASSAHSEAWAEYSDG